MGGIYCHFRVVEVDLTLKHSGIRSLTRAGFEAIGVKIKKLYSENIYQLLTVARISTEEQNINRKHLGMIAPLHVSVCCFSFQVKLSSKGFTQIKINPRQTAYLSNCALKQLKIDLKRPKKPNNDG